MFELFIFFFQAEDGIRDRNVTGVQTCALPIYARFEARDAQYLAGLLADEGLIKGQKIGVTGSSYGGGQSFILGVLRDRTMARDGRLVPWRSPKGKPMRIA